MNMVADHNDVVPMGPGSRCKELNSRSRPCIGRSERSVRPSKPRCLIPEDRGHNVHQHRTFPVFRPNGRPSVLGSGLSFEDWSVNQKRNWCLYLPPQTTRDIELNACEWAKTTRQRGMAIYPTPPRTPPKSRCTPFEGRGSRVRDLTDQ